MPRQTKIVTCCYCGKRAALVLKGETRHELACDGCGAPLKYLKRLKADSYHPRETGEYRNAAGHPFQSREARYAEFPSKRRRKHRKTFGRRIVEEVFDFIEDALD